MYQIPLAGNCLCLMTKNSNRNQKPMRNNKQNKRKHSRLKLQIMQEVRNKVQNYHAVFNDHNNNFIVNK